MDAEAAGMEEGKDMKNSVMCQLTDPEGTPLGPSMYLPQSAGPKELQQIVNQLLNNVSTYLGIWFLSDYSSADFFFPFYDILSS